MTESCTICCSHSRQPVWKLLDIPSYIKKVTVFRNNISYSHWKVNTDTFQQNNDFNLNYSCRQTGRAKYILTVKRVMMDLVIKGKKKA
jgi:hypothetical protein